MSNGALHLSVLPSLVPATGQMGESKAACSWIHNARNAQTSYLPDNARSCKPILRLCVCMTDMPFCPKSSMPNQALVPCIYSFLCLPPTWRRNTIQYCTCCLSHMSACKRSPMCAQHFRYVAKRYNQSSVLGSYLDPLADKVLIGCVVGALGYQVLPTPPASLSAAFCISCHHHLLKLS